VVNIYRSVWEAQHLLTRGVGEGWGQALRFQCVVVMTDEKYEAVQRENAWDDEACGDRIARVDVVDDVCGMVIHFIAVRNADENRRVLRPSARVAEVAAK
jgi:hypothetical protein